MSKFNINEYDYNNVNTFDCTEDLIVDIIKFYRPKKFNKLYNKIFNHGIRVVKNCELIIMEETKMQGQKIMTKNEMVNLLRIAAPLHDIGKVIEDKNHEHVCAEMVSIILKNDGYMTENNIENIYNMIKLHGCKNIESRPHDMSLCDKILMDADYLDERCGESLYKRLINLYSLEKDNLNTEDFNKIYIKFNEVKSKSEEIMNKLNLESSKSVYLKELEKTKIQIDELANSLYLKQLRDNDIKYKNTLKIIINNINDQ